MNNNVHPSLFSEIKEVPPLLQGNYYPSLNGFRAVAIIIVVFYHLHLSWSPIYTTVFNGQLGVLIFFVLSGFLITTLCVKEKVLKKDIALKNFYIRRALRILPVAYLYILVVVILNFFFKFNISGITIIGASLYLLNLAYFGKFGGESKLGHFWSLSVEEQFYLIFPFILKKSFKGFVIAVVSLIFLVPVYVFFNHVTSYLDFDICHKLVNYLVKFQGIAVGCLFSILLFKYPVNINSKIKVVTNLVCFVLIFFLRFTDRIYFNTLLPNLVISLLIGYVIVSNLPASNDFIFKGLNNKVLNTIGNLSYSIYIWQQLFTYPESKFPFFINQFPYNLISLTVVSCLSYYFYEKYFLRFKTKFSGLKKHS